MPKILSIIFNSLLNEIIINQFDIIIHLLNQIRIY